MLRTLPPGGSTSVVVNFTAPLNASDTARFKLDVTAADGTKATSNIKLNLRPATPIPVTDPKGVMVGLNPGSEIVKTIKIPNKGLGEMNGIRLEQPATIPWIRAGNLSRVNLLPQESATFDVTFAPGAAISLGQYQDKVVVTNGNYSAMVTVAAEISSASLGGISFIVSDDTGSRVSNADISFVGKEPYTFQEGGQTRTYYQTFAGRTNSEGIVTLTDKPLGEYSYSISASGRKKLTGDCSIMPGSNLAPVEAVMESLPVQIEWTVVPTTIQDEYEIKLNLEFGVNIPKPNFGFIPPWINVPKNVQSAMVVEAQIVNTGLIALTDVTAQIVREKSTDTGISIIGGGYIGEIPAHGSVRLQLQVQPGSYLLKYNGAPNHIKLKANYVSFDPDTGLPEIPQKSIEAKLPCIIQARLPSAFTIKPVDGGAARTEGIPRCPRGSSRDRLSPASTCTAGR